MGPGMATGGHDGSAGRRSPEGERDGTFLVLVRVPAAETRVHYYFGRIITRTEGGIAGTLCGENRTNMRRSAIESSSARKREISTDCDRSPHDARGVRGVTRTRSVLVARTGGYGDIARETTPKMTAGGQAGDGGKRPGRAEVGMEPRPCA